MFLSSLFRSSPFWSYYLYPNGCNFHKGNCMATMTSIDVPYFSTLAFGSVAFRIPKGFRDGDNTVFLLAAVHVEHHFECSIYWADALLYKGLIHNRIGHEEIHEEKRPFLFAGTKSLPYLCQCNGNTNPFCRLNNTRRLLQKSFATYSSTTQTYSINTNFSKLWELSNKESWEASQEE